LTLINPCIEWGPWPMSNHINYCGITVRIGHGYSLTSYTFLQLKTHLRLVLVSDIHDTNGNKLRI